MPASTRVNLPRNDAADPHREIVMVVGLQTATDDEQKMGVMYDDVPS